MQTPWQVTVERCAQAALTGSMSFPQIIGQLIDAGVERYHADYTRREMTFYLADGQSHVVAVDHPVHAIAVVFDAAAVAAAVGQSQRQEHTFLDFIKKTMAAGCVGYFVQIAGQRVIYFGRTGDSHVEYFPGARKD